MRLTFTTASTFEGVSDGSGRRKMVHFTRRTRVRERNKAEIQKGGRLISVPENLPSQCTPSPLHR